MNAIFRLVDNDDIIVAVKFADAIPGWTLSDVEAAAKHWAFDQPQPLGWRNLVIEYGGRIFWYELRRTNRNKPRLRRINLQPRTKDPI